MYIHVRRIEAISSGYSFKYSWVYFNDVAKLPKGRAVRIRSIAKVIRAFERLQSDRLTFDELKAKTGLSPKALLGTLNEMIELGSIIRVENQFPPPDVYYSPAATSDMIDELEKSYSVKVSSLSAILDSDFQVEQNSIQVSLESYRQQLQSLEKDKNTSLGTLESISNKYKAELYRAIDSIDHAISESHQRTRPKEWEKCSNCKNFKRESQQCTKTWLIGSRPVVKSDSYCKDFEMRR